MSTYLWLLASTLIAAFGGYLSKVFSIDPTFYSGIRVVAVYMTYTVCWLMVMRTGVPLAVWGTIFSITALASGFVIGMWLFGETLTPMQIGGLALATMATVMLTL